MDKRASSADISVQRFWYDSAGPVFYNQVKGLLGCGVPTSQLVFGSVSLLDIVALVPSPQLKPATTGSSLRTKNHLHRIDQRNRQCWIPDSKGEAGLVPAQRRDSVRFEDLLWTFEYLQLLIIYLLWLFILHRSRALKNLCLHDARYKKSRFARTFTLNECKIRPE